MLIWLKEAGLMSGLYISTKPQFKASKQVHLPPLILQLLSGGGARKRNRSGGVAAAGGALTVLSFDIPDGKVRDGSVQYSFECVMPLLFCRKRFQHLYEVRYMPQAHFLLSSLKIMHYGTGPLLRNQTSHVPKPGVPWRVLYSVQLLSICLRF